MKHAALFVIALATSVIAPAPAQENAVKTGRKPMTFQTGAKLPDQAAATPPAAAAEKPAEKITAAPAIVTPTGPAEVIHAFFGLLEKEEIDAAYGGLTKGSKIAERPEELRALKTKTKEAIDVFGLIRGYDLVESKPVGARLVRTTYLSLGKEFPLRWRFYFYKAEEVWRLIDLRVDDKLTGIFDESEEVKPADKP